MDKFVVIDLETTGNSTENNDKIIEVGIVIIRGDKIVDEFSTLLYPNKPIPPFIVNLTGITDEDVKNAPKFSDVAETIVNIFKDSYLVAHNVPFDLGFLNDELVREGLNPLVNPVIDTVELSRILFPNSPGYKLSELSTHFNLGHDAPHRALSDAHVTAKLLLKLKAKLKSLPYETFHQLLKLEKNLKSDLTILLNDLSEQLQFSNDASIMTYGGLAFKNIEWKQSTKDEITLSFGSYLDSIYEEDGYMEQIFHRYEKRNSQREMSEIIYDCFQSHKHGLIEAETGTGKSLAYLIPAAYHATRTKSKVIISTYTTQLQTQLLEEEIPMLQQLTDFNIDTALLKGKQHYISLEKFARELEWNDEDNYDIALTKAILLVWLTETETGDIDEIHLPSSGYYFFKKVSADSEMNEHFKSPWFIYSYYQKAKKKAQAADLIITNHALLSTDLFNDYRILPTYKYVIIDEAHHLEETVSKNGGLKINYVAIQHTLNEIGKQEYLPSITEEDLVTWFDLIHETKHEVDDLFSSLFQYVLNQQEKHQSISDTGRVQYRIDYKKEDKKRWDIIMDMAVRVKTNFSMMIEYLSNNNEDIDDTIISDQMDKYTELLQSYRKALNHFFITTINDIDVNWVEIDAFGAKNAVYLYSESIDVSEMLTEKFFEQKLSAIMTSATLTMKNSFSYTQKRLGLDDEMVVSKQISSPFPYEQQVQLMVPSDFPDITSQTTDEFIKATSDAIISLAKITNGRMLVLFTSYDMLKRTHQHLKDELDITEYALIAQGISSGSRSRLKKNFQTFHRAILLGTSSFWEGVDIPGEDLSCLVIVRLPFQPPKHPVYEAKANYLKQKKKNPFYELALPNAVIRFKQGFGRLIRSNKDRGIVFICDTRFIKANYSSNFRKSIPNVPIHYQSTQELMNLAKDWF